MNDNWSLIQALYQDRLGIPGHILNYVAVNDILRGCAHGLANSTIAKHCDYPLSYVVQTLHSFLAVVGWELDLDITPYFFYQNCAGNFDLFYYNVTLITELLSDDEIITAFAVCRSYAKIQLEIERYYAKS